MRETPGVSDAAIGRLRQQIQGLMDADLILPEDGQWLMATLDATLQRPDSAHAQTAGSAMQGLIERLLVLVQTGDLETAAAHPPVEMARTILASLRG